MLQHCCRCCGCWLKENAFFEKATHEKESLAVEQVWNGSQETDPQVVATTRGHCRGQLKPRGVGGRGLRRPLSPFLVLREWEGEGFSNWPFIICKLGACFHCHLSAVPYFHGWTGGKKRSRFTVVGRIGVNWPSSRCWRPLSDFQ